MCESHTVPLTSKLIPQHKPKQQQCLALTLSQQPGVSLLCMVYFSSSAISVEVSVCTLQHSTVLSGPQSAQPCHGQQRVASVPCDTLV